MKYIERFLRYLIIAAGALTQILLLMLTFHYFSNQYVWIEVLLRLFGTVICIYIVNNTRYLSMNIIWVLLIALFPVTGTLVFLILGANLFRSKTAHSLYQADLDLRNNLINDDKVNEEMNNILPSLKGDFHYISKTAGYPFYRNSSFEYYKSGEEVFPVMLQQLDKAEKFIFIEYFIIEEGYMWEKIHDILKKKAQKGVDVRVMYDDAGSMRTLSVFYSRKLEKEGIKCVRFNKINPFIGAVMNHRDHRKIMVIDGKVAFSGGINLADEYINKKEKYGYWKDNAIKIAGQAVWSYTLMFLTTWNGLRKTDDDYQKFKVNCDEVTCDGYIAPYGCSPLSQKENVGRNIYINIINSAVKYVYIVTPYLIIDTDLENALILAAQKGVDVRIITPGIPDKRVVFWITQSFYNNLISGGVKIYEYTPGFIHGKTFICDDLVATVGTINLDYRSLYLHYENGTYLCNSSKISDILADYQQTLKVSKEITKDNFKVGVIKRIFVGIAKLFVSQM